MRRDRTSSLFVEILHKDPEGDDDFDFLATLEFKFEEPGALRRRLDLSSVCLASSFLSDLERHYRGEQDLCAAADPHIWRLSVDDVLRLAEPCFRVTWSLSDDPPESSNSDQCRTLTEAWDVLGDSGALMTLPGNSGPIRIGSVTWYATWFTSEGIDQGDSHIDPDMAKRADGLFKQILAAEAMSQAA